MKRIGTILLGLIFVMLASSVSYADLAITAESPEASGGEIAGGAPFTVNLFWDYTQASGSYTMDGVTFGVHFYSPDGSIKNISHRDVGGDGPFNSITFSDYWTTEFTTVTQINFDQDYSWDGTLDDTVFIFGLNFSGGPGPNTGKEEILSFALQVNNAVGGTSGQLCIDSSGQGLDDVDWVWLFASEVGAVTFNGPYCWTITGLTPTDVTELDNDNNLPTEFGLGQNYPNPFNPTTTFEFSLPVKSNVEIQVFNVLGQKITTLADQEYPAGVYQVTWDGTNDAGQQIASGIYFYSMKAGSFSETRKLMMVK